MDLSKLSDSDLQQIAKGDLRMVSENGLKLLAGEAPQDEGMFANLSYKNVPQNLGNLTAGALRGAGSIGATILAPKDMLVDALDGKGLSLESNRARRKAMDEGLKLMGANPESGLYAAGKIGTEIAGTAGLGNALAGTKLLAQAPKLANAVRSGGFSLGDTSGNAILNGATRVAGGAITGGASAGMVDPESAGLGAVIGGAIPAVGKAGYETFKLGGRAVAPFTKKGQEKILANNLINMIGSNASGVANNLAKAKGNTVGFVPSAGQVGDSAELAAFERMFKQRNAGLFGDFSKAQSEALATAANSLGGDDLARINLVNARDDAVNTLYESAKGQRVIGDEVLSGLSNRPAFKDAIRAAETNAANNGEKFVLGETINMPKLAGDGHLAVLPDEAYFNEAKRELISGGKGNTLLQEIKKLGGINQSHLRDITGEKVASKARSQVGLFNKNGLGADDLASQMHDLGFIPNEEMAVDGGVGYLKESIRNSLGGEKAYALGDAPLYAPITGQMVDDTVGDIGSYFNQTKGDKVYSGKSLQEIKFALDKMKNSLPKDAQESATIGGYRNTSSAYNSWLNDVLPDMRKADSLFAEKSKPINQLDIGNEIRDRFIPARYRGDSAPLQFNRNELAKILNDSGDTLAKKVTGFKGSTLKGELSNKQYQDLQNIVKDNKLIDLGDNLGRGIGSPTYQHLAYNAKGENSGLLGKIAGVSSTGRALSSARDFLLTKPLQKMDADMAKMLQDPNTTGLTIQRYLKQSNAPKPAINAILEKYGLLNVPSVAIAQ